MSKNRVIFILVVLIIIGGIWGSLADRKKVGFEKKLHETVAQMQKLTEQSSRQRDLVLGKTAGLQETLAKKEQQLGKARKELVSLRKESQALESQLSDCNVTLQKINQEKKVLLDEISAAQVTAAAKNPDITEQKAVVSPSTTEKGSDEQTGQAAVEEEIGVSEASFLQEQILTAELTIDRLQQRLDAEKAQMMGLEKLLEEKSSAMEETSQDMDRLKINMDVLLSKIADQRDNLQEIQEENRDLIKELAARNEEVADLQEELMRQPVKE